MNLFEFINAVSVVIWTMFVASGLVSALLHFFKKETMLKRLRLNNFEVAFFSLPFAIISGLGLLLSYAITDSGISVGFMILMCCITMILFAVFTSAISEWRKKLPRT